MNHSLKLFSKGADLLVFFVWGGGGGGAGGWRGELEDVEKTFIQQTKTRKNHAQLALYYAPLCN